ncbi:aspartyl protease family protein [Delftia tsuruhatensis]|uniref:aspartyl protease family protein n=1 Tax=Delftia tsuruhatensis TaxID=180282 RepID=UPI003C7B2E73
MPFLIDTGADTTMVNEDLMRSLGIPRRGSRDVVGSTTHIDPTPCDSYDVSFEIHTPGEIPLAVPALEVLARPFFNVSIYGLIGRDVLDKYQLTMGHGRFRLDY